MGIPKRGRRTVDVDGAEYGWYVRKRGTYLQNVGDTPMTVAIERQRPKSPTPSALIVQLSVTRPDNWIETHQTGVLPRDIRLMIAQAMAEGWNPEGGKRFLMRFAVIKHSC